MLIPDMLLMRFSGWYVARGASGIPRVRRQNAHRSVRYTMDMYTRERRVAVGRLRVRASAVSDLAV